MSSLKNKKLLYPIWAWPYPFLVVRNYEVNTNKFFDILKIPQRFCFCRPFSGAVSFFGLHPKIYFHQSREIMYQTIESRAMKRGFALVVTLSLMILLTVIAVALLSISAVSLRSTLRGVAQAEAQTNARLALMLAIGELQKNAGSDTRITAPADILDSGNPPLTGVWRSWEGTDHETTGALAGRPLKPDYSKKRSSTADGGRFLTWLVSSKKTSMIPGDAASLVLKTPSPSSIPLVSVGSLASGDDRQVHVEPVSANGRGRFAWWASGENQKARLPKPIDPKVDSVAAWSDFARSHAVADPKGFELESLLTDASPVNKAFTLATADLFAKAGSTVRPHQFFHDLTVTSSGLLTNVAIGGWRKDLSLFTESWDSQPSSNLPLFGLSSGTNATFTRPSATEGGYRIADSLFYPWSDYRNLGTTTSAEYYQRQVGAVSSWANLASYATFYRSPGLSFSASGNGTTPTQSWKYNGNPQVLYDNFHKVRIVPKIARLQWIFSHYAVDASTVLGSSGAGKLIPCVLVTPVITLWNPFNFTINQGSQSPTGRYVFRIDSVMPPAFKYEIGGVSDNQFYALGARYNSGQSGYEPYNISRHWETGYDLPGNIILKPGETRVYSPANGTFRQIVAAPVNSTKFSMTLAEGFRPGNGLIYRLDNVVAPGSRITPAEMARMAFDPGATIKVTGAKFDAEDEEGPGVGIKGQMGFTYTPVGGAVNLSQMEGHLIFSGKNKRAEAQALYPAKGKAAAASLGEARNEPVPFMSMIFGDRIASKTHSDDGRATKGVVQSSPLIYYTAIADRYGVNDVEDGRYLAMDNLLNSSWDFSFVYHTPGGDDYFPQVNNTSGYIITGFQPIDGITRCVLAELPGRPLTSLGDLTHWDFRLNNPVPPFGLNLIGNSDATPLIPSDAVINSTESMIGAGQNRQHDDSYCANHLLFDDWFCSSITPQPTNFGSIGQSQKENFTDFLLGTDPLTNRAYRPILEDSVTDLSAATKIYNDRVAPVNSWQTIASRLEVEGMFNVNSTSVKAWRALLGHARNQKIPYSLANGDATLSSKTDYAISRTSIAGDQKAGTKVPGVSPQATEFTGYRVFDKVMLDKLAEKIVEEVRLRGPFLSLSEFVNRQLSSNKDLALAGAIQAALNKLAKDSSLNPFANVEQVSSPSLANPPGNDEYQFPEAAVGYNTYGLPGWTRQADIIRPLAPILSARDDTFTIRAYGDARSPDGKVLAKAWCEATVRRSRKFSDESESPDITTPPSKPINQIFGRKFEVVSFRWLSPNEV